MPQPQDKAKPTASTSSSTPAAHFQFYTLPVISPRGPTDESFAVRQLITFPSQKRRMRFLLYLRDYCQGRRKGEWAAIPGERNFAKALDYADFHGCCVYDLTVRKAPTPEKSGSGAKRHVCADDSDGCADSDGEDNVVEEDITDMYVRGEH